MRRVHRKVNVTAIHTVPQSYSVYCSCRIHTICVFCCTMFLHIDLYMCVFMYMGYMNMPCPHSGWAPCSRSQIFLLNAVFFIINLWKMIYLCFRPMVFVPCCVCRCWGVRATYLECLKCPTIFLLTETHVHFYDLVQPCWWEPFKFVPYSPNMLPQLFHYYVNCLQAQNASYFMFHCLSMFSKAFKMQIG